MSDKASSNDDKKRSIERRYSTREDEVDFIELWNVFWAAKKFIILVIGICALVAVAYAYMQVSIFRAESVLAPAEARQSSSPLAAQLGGAAALIGISASPPASSQVMSALAILESREFIVKFITKYKLLVPLFDTGWDNSSEQTIVDVEDRYSEQIQDWIEMDLMPTEWQAYRAFSEILRVSTDLDTGLIQIAIEWQDPVEAALWVNLLVAELNSYIKERDLAEANNAIEFLQAQLANTQLVEMQRVFYQLIESQTRIIMLADVRDEYVFRVIDPAVVPDERIYPRRSQILMIGLFLGLILALALVLVRYFITKSIELNNSDVVGG